MFTIFENILLGHLVGDYLLQSKKMALIKSAPGLNAFLWCLLHSLLYTFSICLFTGTLDPLKISLIFLSHFPIDRWSLASKWLNLIKGRNFLTTYQTKDKYWEIDLSFSAIVYVIVDNTMHILLMAAIFKYL